MKTTFDPGTTVPVITARGIIRAVNTGTSANSTSLFEKVVRAIEEWVVPPTTRVVDIAITASVNALPRFYRNVPWSNINSLLHMKAPLIGDSVMLGFTGDFSEFPHIRRHYPDKSSSAAAQTAVAPAPAAPSQIQAAAFKPLGADLSGVMNIVGGFRSVASFASLLTPESSLY